METQAYTRVPDGKVPQGGFLFGAKDPFGQKWEPIDFSRGKAMEILQRALTVGGTPFARTDFAAVLTGLAERRYLMPEAYWETIEGGGDYQIFPTAVDGRIVGHCEAMLRVTAINGLTYTVRFSSVIDIKRLRNRLLRNRKRIASGRVGNTSIRDGKLLLYVFANLHPEYATREAVQEVEEILDSCRSFRGAQIPFGIAHPSYRSE